MSIEQSVYRKIVGLKEEMEAITAGIKSSDIILDVDAKISAIRIYVGGRIVGTDTSGESSSISGELHEALVLAIRETTAKHKRRLMKRLMATVSNAHIQIREAMKESNG